LHIHTINTNFNHPSISPFLPPLLPSFSVSFSPWKFECNNKNIDILRKSPNNRRTKTNEKTTLPKFYERMLRKHKKALSAAFPNSVSKEVRKREEERISGRDERKRGEEEGRRTSRSRVVRRVIGPTSAFASSSSSSSLFLSSLSSFLPFDHSVHDTSSLPLFFSFLIGMKRMTSLLLLSLLLLLSILRLLPLHHSTSPLNDFSLEIEK
jgi:hypothetical protein